MKNDDIKGVLLPDGWHKCEDGSFMRTAMQAGASETASWIETIDRVRSRIVAPWTHILALRLPADADVKRAAGVAARSI